MSKQASLKQADELRCLRAAQDSLAGFPQGAIGRGDDPPDFYVEVPGGGDVAFEVTEQVDWIAARAADLANHFFEEANREFFRRHPEHLTGWRIALSPGDVFETIAAEPKNANAWVRRKPDLIERFVSAVAGELVKRYTVEWRVPGEPIWTFHTREKVHPCELTSVTFHGGWAYSLKGRDRIENEFGRDVTFKPSVIQARIAKKISGLRRYECRPAYLLISAPPFPRSVRTAGSFPVLTTPQSIVDYYFDIGGFSAVFLHDFQGRSYRIGQDGRAVELRERPVRLAEPRL